MLNVTITTEFARKCQTLLCLERDFFLIAQTGQLSCLFAFSEFFFLPVNIMELLIVLSSPRDKLGDALTQPLFSI